MVFCCNLHSLTFLRKSIVLPSIFLCKTNASAPEFLTEIIRPSSSFFSQPYAVLNVHACMEKVNANISIFLWF